MVFPQMATRNELKKLANTRLEEAKALYTQGLYDGACYLAGYVIELALKARICKILDVTNFIDSGEISRSFKTHNLDDLMKLSGLQKKFETAKNLNTSLLANWSILTQWNEGYRYKPVGSSRRVIAKDTIEALENAGDGVFTWIKKYW